MRSYILRRILLSIIILIGVSIIIFVAGRLSGDVALLLAPMDATEAELQAIRANLGLDQPLPVQYLVFIKNAVQGDFGMSIVYDQPAIRLVLNRFPASLQLGLSSFAMALTLGILFGVISATMRGSLVDWAGKMFAMLGLSLPEFWVSIMLILVFGVYLKWLPTSGRGTILHMIMPVFALGWFGIAGIMRLTRSSLLEALDGDYIKMARMKGNPERVVIWKHALRNALIPVAGLSGMHLATVIGGAVIVETIFCWPGVGSLMTDAVFNRDYPLLQAGTLIISCFIIGVNLLVDLLYGVIDPRIRYS